MIRADQKADVNQTCQQSVFSPIRTCIRIWCTAGAVERRSQMFVYRPFRFSLSLVPRSTKGLFTGYPSGTPRSTGLSLRYFAQIRFKTSQTSRRKSYVFKLPQKYLPQKYPWRYREIAYQYFAYWQHRNRPVVFHQKIVFSFIQGRFTSNLSQGRDSSICNRFINQICYWASKLQFSISQQPCRYFVHSTCLVDFQRIQASERVWGVGVNNNKNSLPLFTDPSPKWTPP